MGKKKKLKKMMIAIFSNDNCSRLWLEKLNN